MTNEIQQLSNCFKNASKAAEYMSYAFLSIKNDLDKIIAKQKTREFTKVILVTVAILLTLTLILK